MEKWKIYSRSHRKNISWNQLFSNLISLVKTMLSRNFCQKCVGANFPNFHSRTVNSLFFINQTVNNSSKNIPWNQRIWIAQCGKVHKNAIILKFSVKSHNKKIANSTSTNGWFSTLRGHFWNFYTKWILETRIHTWFDSKENFFELMKIIWDILYQNWSTLKVNYSYGPQWSSEVSMNFSSPNLPL